MAVSSTRRLRNWITGFRDYTKNMGVPELFKSWAAVSTISGALERRCKLMTALGPLYPNLFVVLVSPPGIGKSVIIKSVADFWTKMGNLNVAPSSMTRAGMIDFMVKTKRVELMDGLPNEVHSLLCAASEFGNLVPIYDNAWLNTLNDIYDCGSYFSDMTRSLGEMRLDNPHMVILAGTQPKYLDNLLPETAFGMGFTSRIIMVYAGEKQYKSLFEKVIKSTTLGDYLNLDLTRIAEMKGDFFLTPEARTLWDDLAPKGFPPAPNHSKLQHYNSRREAHMLKLMMCFSAAENESFKITDSHILQAQRLLHETEAQMPQIFQEMVSKGFADANEELWSFVMRNWIANGRKPVQESVLIKFLYGKVPNNQIKQTLDLMVQAGQLKVQQAIGAAGAYRTYIPQQK